MRINQTKDSLRDKLHACLKGTGGERTVLVRFDTKNATQISFRRLHFTTRTVFVNDMPVILPLKDDICWRQDFLKHWDNIWSVVCQDADQVYAEILWAEKWIGRK